jgi:hypothetical protein
MDSNTMTVMFRNLLIIGVIVASLFIVPWAFQRLTNADWPFVGKSLASWKAIAVLCTAAACGTAVYCAEVMRPAEFVPVVAHSDGRWKLYRVATHDAAIGRTYQKLTDSGEAARVESLSGS